MTLYGILPTYIFKFSISGSRGSHADRAPGFPGLEAATRDACRLRLGLLAGCRGKAHAGLQAGACSIDDQGGLVHSDNFSETKELSPILDIRPGKE